MADILPKKTPGRVEIDPTAVEDALPSAGAAQGGGALGGAGDTATGLPGMEFLSPFEAEHYVEELRAFTLDEVGGKEKIEQIEHEVHPRGAPLVVLTAFSVAFKV